jgi:hypothetical protein
MKNIFLILLTLISISCFSQSISYIKVGPNPITTSTFTTQFKVNYADTVSLNIYDIWGMLKCSILNKEFLKAGTYKIEYTFSTGLTNGVYILFLISSDKKLGANIICDGVTGLTKPTNITYIDSIKVYDTTKVTVTDTTKVLIIDTLNCVKTTTNLRNYRTFPSTESIVFHNNLTITFSDVDNLMLYDLTGKLIRRLTINSNLINLQDLKNGIYIGLFYESGDIIKTIKMIKD